MTRYLSESDVAQLIDRPLALAAVTLAHEELAAARAIDIPRQRTRLPQTALHLLQGALPSCNVIGYKAYTSNRSGVRFWVHLFAADSGEPLAVIAANRLGMMRTAAASALASRWLARPEASVFGLFGTGWQAEGHLAAVADVLPLNRVKVWGRNPDKLAAFCQRMSAQLNLEVSAAGSAEATVRGSDVIGTVTTATRPLFDASWVAPGTHLNAAGSNALIRQELPEALLARCALIAVDTRDTALREAGDLAPALEKGRLHERQLVELGDILCGRQPGRGTPEAITLFESQGLAIQDLALGIRLYERACARGLGSELPY